ncbi:MAG: 50S ribosomal protein L29 [Canidatus Methanoxibalbensis ujae]|nr:50S ribosomal protein L29 [Candidatus Methanoxibalbensis ujae]MCW7078124.1 50S ribosomal protein L29 [Candidatus Methanoxibalbensis ujae]RLG38680.1 MAG: 50S ribosomal protein L29 [Methanosarcinales archaeon]
MGILKSDEIRKMSDVELLEELEKLQMDLIRERGIIATGGAPENPGRIREIRRTIARIKTIMHERREREGT